MLLSTIPANTKLKINLYNVQNPMTYTPDTEYLVNVEIVNFWDTEIKGIVEGIHGINIIPSIMLSKLVP